MNYFYINVKDLCIKEKNHKYNFISEMYPVINLMYSKLWFLENMSVMNNEIKTEKIFELRQEIDNMLKSCNIPKRILLLQSSNKYIEPITNSSFNIDTNCLLTFANEKDVNAYIDEYQNNKSYISNMKKYKQKVLNIEKRM